MVQKDALQAKNMTCIAYVFERQTKSLHLGKKRWQKYHSSTTLVHFVHPPFTFSIMRHERCKRYLAWRAPWCSAYTTFFLFHSLPTITPGLYFQGHKPHPYVLCTLINNIILSCLFATTLMADAEKNLKRMTPMLAPDKNINYLMINDADAGNWKRFASVFELITLSKHILSFTWVSERTCPRDKECND